MQELGEVGRRVHRPVIFQKSGIFKKWENIKSQKEADLGGRGAHAAVLPALEHDVLVYVRRPIGSFVKFFKVLSIFILAAMALGFFASIGIWAAVSFLRLFGIDTL